VRTPQILNASSQYRLVRPIAQGGMGCVYEAVQTGVEDFHKRVAIKIIRQEYSEEPLFRKNFVGEARLAADLIHPNIVQTYQLGFTRNRYFMVMEFVDGVNLEQFLLQHKALGKQLPWQLAAFIASRVARALAHAHVFHDAAGKNLKIVHRDVSPRNILISVNGDVKLTDFGIAKAFDLMYCTEGQIIAGRSDYLSPEQAHMEVTDHRADIFSCGVVLAEMLLGYNPFAAATPEESREAICARPTPNPRGMNPDIREALIPVLNTALAKNREDRFATAQELMAGIETVIYAHEYGPTNEKLAAYFHELYEEGTAYEDDLAEGNLSIDFSAPEP
jgi:serine/threonine protein kinase